MRRRTRNKAVSTLIQPRQGHHLWPDPGREIQNLVGRLGTLGTMRRTTRIEAGPSTLTTHTGAPSLARLRTLIVKKQYFVGRPGTLGMTRWPSKIEAGPSTLMTHTGAPSLARHRTPCVNMSLNMSKWGCGCCMMSNALFALRNACHPGT